MTNKRMPKTGVVDPDYSVAATHRVAVHMRKFNRIFVSNPMHKKLTSKLDSLRLRGIDSSADYYQALRCVAPAASGKTTVAKRYVQAINATVPKGEQRIPVVYVSVQNASTPKKLMSSILEAMGDIGAKSGTEVQLKRRVSTLIRMYGVELIILDEIHHLARHRDNTEVVNCLKSFLNDKICPLALIGTECALPLLTKNAEIAQRIGIISDIPPVTLNETDQQMLSKFLAMLDREIKVREIFATSSDFINRGEAACLHKVSGGVLGLIIRIVEAALEIAVRRNASSIESYDLNLAVENWAIPNGFCKTNPFKEL